MAITLSEIRITIERRVGLIDNEFVIDVCNDVNSELTLLINLEDTAVITINTEDIVYTEPENIRRINRLWLTSERDAGVDRDISNSFRRYNGELIFKNRFTRADTLNVEFYKNFTYFTKVEDVIDIADRYSTLYTSYGMAQYFDLPDVVARLGDLSAKRQYEKHYGRYLSIQSQIAAQYNLEIQPSTIKEVY